MDLNSGSTARITPVTLRFGVFFDGIGNNLSNVMPADAPGARVPVMATP